MPTDWSAVYAATWTDLVRFLYHKVWDGERARDLAQEVFVRALDQDPVDTRAWLFTVAANLARDEARTAIRRKKHLELIKAEPHATPPNPADQAEGAERAAMVRAALSELSERDREVLLLWDAGLDYDAIARESGLAKSAIGTTLSRARTRLVKAHERLEGRDVASG